jgi:hypothetical protein
MYMWKELMRSKNHVQRLFAINESAEDRCVEFANIIKLEILLPGLNKSYQNIERHYIYIYY